ncbi:MAG: hypothetical protein EBV75_07345 [Acidimicrobiia bacterium]|nr:hypothetical protein [Acidimicrobiia bacterium]
MFNNPQFWWFLSRASGIVAWALLTGSVLWGILLATRMLKAIDRPAWLLDLHRWLSALTIFAVALHLVALYADSYVEFSVTDLMVPFVATWRTIFLGPRRFMNMPKWASSHRVQLLHLQFWL